MNNIKRVISLLMMLVLAIALGGCTKKQTLDTPVISLNEAILSWNSIDNASKYEVNVNGDKFETTKLEYDLSYIKAHTFNIKVRAIGDNKKYLDSEESKAINITVQDMVSVEKGEMIADKIRYKVTVEAKEDVLGFVIGIKYDNDKLSLIDGDIKLTQLLPNKWLYDINHTEGEIKIAVTGLDPINVRLKQSLLYLDFLETDDSGTVTIKTYIIDNG